MVPHGFVFLILLEILFNDIRTAVGHMGVLEIKAELDLLGFPHKRKTGN